MISFDPILSCIITSSRITASSCITTLSHLLHASHSHILTYSDRPGYLKLPLSYIEPISSLVWHCFIPSSDLPSSLPSSLPNNLRTASECHVDTSIMEYKEYIDIEQNWWIEEIPPSSDCVRYLTCRPWFWPRPQQWAQYYVQCAPLVYFSMIFYCIWLYPTSFYSILLHSTSFYSILPHSTSSYLVLLCSTLFYFVLPCSTLSYLVLLCPTLFYLILTHSTLSYCVLPHPTSFYFILLRPTLSYCILLILLYSTSFYLVLPSFSSFYLILLHYTPSTLYIWTYLPSTHTLHTL